MTNHHSLGDRVVCKIKDDKVVNIYDDSYCQNKAFDIVAIHKEGYLVYVPPSIFVKTQCL